MSKNEITVLLVEDEVTLAKIIKDTLEEVALQFIRQETEKKDYIFSLNYARMYWSPT